MGRAVSLRAVRGNEKAGAECQLSSPYSPLDVLVNTLSWDPTWHSGRCQRLLKEKGFGRIYKPFPWEFLFWFLFCLQTKQDLIFFFRGGGVRTFFCESVDDRLFSALLAKYTTDEIRVESGRSAAEPAWHLARRNFNKSDTNVKIWRIQDEQRLRVNINAGAIYQWAHKWQQHRVPEFWLTL